MSENSWASRVQRLRRSTGKLLVAAILPLCLLAGLYALGDTILDPIPSPRQPDFLDSLIASSAVLAALRVATIAAAGYVVVSVVALAGRRQWLTRVGPVEVSAQVSELEAENGVLREMLVDAKAKVDELDEELAAAEGALTGGLGKIGERGGHDDPR